jgi:hypothetical protein
MQVSELHDTEECKLVATKLVPYFSDERTCNAVLVPLFGEKPILSLRTIHFAIDKFAGPDSTCWSPKKESFIHIKPFIKSKKSKYSVNNFSNYARKFTCTVTYKSGMTFKTAVGVLNMLKIISEHGILCWIYENLSTILAHKGKK